MMASTKNTILPISGPSRDTDILFKGSTMTKKGACAAVSYMTCAVLLVMLNKAVLSSYNFPCVNVITLLQMISSSIILLVMKKGRIITFARSESRSSGHSSFTLVPIVTLLHTSPLALTYLFYMIVTMESVRGVNVPMYTALRKTTVVFTMITEYLIIGQKYSMPTIGSVALIVAGAFVAGLRDFSFNSYGYMVVFIANISTAIYLTTVARIAKATGLNSFGLMWCNGLICGPVLLFWTFFHGDLDATLNFHMIYSLKFQVMMLLSCVMAFFLNYCIFLNTTLNSAVAQTICGNLKDLFTVGLGWMIFGGLPFDALNVVGQLLGFLGSCLYAYCKVTGK